MSYLSRPDSWEKHQRLEISRFVASYIGGGYTDRDFVPLYPGSMLFNQIALADNGCSLQSAVYDQPRIESLDAVYEALAYSTNTCLLYTSPSPRDQRGSRMPSSA